MATIQTTVEVYEGGVLVGSQVIEREETDQEIEARTYTTNLAAELQSYKADRDALIAALDAAVAAIPNNAFTGASQLKTALRELADMERATRRMFRAAIRDVAALDDGS